MDSSTSVSLPFSPTFKHSVSLQQKLTDPTKKPKKILPLLLLPPSQSPFPCRKKKILEQNFKSCHIFFLPFLVVKKRRKTEQSEQKKE